MRFLKSFDARTRRWSLLAIAALVIAAGVLGGAVGGRAASLTIHATFTTFASTPGDNAGFTITVSNDGTSNASHTSFTANFGTHNVAAFDNPACSGTGTPTLTCAVGQLNGGAKFVVTAAVATATTDTSVSATLNGTLDPQTPNGTNNRQTDTFSASTTLTLASTAGDSTRKSLALKNQALNAPGGGQSSNLQMPDAFLNNNNFVITSLVNGAATARCTKCPAFATDVTMPAAAAFATTGPFFDGTNVKAFTWTIILPGANVPNGFQLTGIFHDGVKVLPCARDANNQPIPPTTAPGTCFTFLKQDPSSKTITGIGLGIANGKYQYG